MHKHEFYFGGLNETITLTIKLAKCVNIILFSEFFLSASLFLQANYHRDEFLHRYSRIYKTDPS
uniref:Uncharacterized protein n=1 Tax=Parascaris univalens TaxID=6257 RepID=A0A915BJP5_PARUN